MTESPAKLAVIWLAVTFAGESYLGAQQAPLGSRPDPYAPTAPPANYSGTANFGPGSQNMTPPQQATPSSYQPAYGSPAPPPTAVNPSVFNRAPDGSMNQAPNYQPTAPAYSPQQTTPQTYQPNQPAYQPNPAAQPAYQPGYPQLASRTPTPPVVPNLKQFEPAKIVAVVGDQYILAGDVLPQVEQALKPFLDKATTEVERQKIEEQRPIVEAQLTKQLIDTKLMYLEFERKVPKDKLPEIEKKIRTSFEKELADGRVKIANFANDPKKVQELVRRDPMVMRLALIMEEKKLNTLGELDLAMKEYGGSVEQQIRAYGEQRLGRTILGQEITLNPEITHDEMLRFYNEKIEEYSFPAKVRWEVVMVRKDKFRTRDEAFNALAALGNEIYFGAPLAAVAKRSSQGYDAENGGVQEWTIQGALASQVLDQAIFSLPEGKLSQILEDDRGLYIIRVIERKEAGKTPFTEAQDELKAKIKAKKREDQYHKFVDQLRTKTPVWSIYEKDNQLNPNIGGGP